MRRLVGRPHLDDSVQSHAVRHSLHDNKIRNEKGAYTLNRRRQS